MQNNLLFFLDKIIDTKKKQIQNRKIQSSINNICKHLTRTF